MNLSKASETVEGHIEVIKDSSQKIGTIASNSKTSPLRNVIRLQGCNPYLTVLEDKFYQNKIGQFSVMLCGALRFVCKLMVKISAYNYESNIKFE